MMKLLPILMVVMAAGIGPVAAACQPTIPGSVSEAMVANSQRLLCLQQELAEATRQRKYEFELSSQLRIQQGAEIQQRFDALPAPFVPRPVFQ